jgi:DNA-binding TFAR19-related protein (PDSD5 family)
VQQLEMIVRQHLTSDALSRFGNIKAANPELAIQFMLYLNQLIKAGKVTSVNDAQLKTILLQMSNTKKDFKIQRK